MVLAPIVLFVYNRLEHTKKTIQALQKNKLANKSELFIYSDGAKNIEAQESVNSVRKYIDNVDGFKNVSIITRDKNYGLANSIIDGVSKTLNKYTKIIVLEDDLVTSPYFLSFMNKALEFYKDKNRVWHISGWNYPISTDGLDDVFLWRLMNCWGWATWADRWGYFEKDTDILIKEFTKKDIKYLNLDGCNNAWSQVTSNKKGDINTWAIYWYASIIKEKALCVNPVQTFVYNIGNDGSGVNCGNNESYKGILSNKQEINFSTNLEENNLALTKVKQFYKEQKKPFIKRVLNKIWRILNVR